MLSEQRKLPDLSELKVTNHMNREAIQQMTQLPDRDVVFVRFQSEGIVHSCLPYFIAIDEHSNSVGQSFCSAVCLCSLVSLCHPKGVVKKGVHGNGITHVWCMCHLKGAVKTGVLATDTTHSWYKKHIMHLSQQLSTAVANRGTSNLQDCTTEFI